MYDDRGYHKLYERIHHEVEEETQHADALIRRILFLEGTPDLSKPDPLHVGSDVKDMLEKDLKVEYTTIDNVRKAIALCEQEGDYQNREMLEKLLEDSEEDHAYWLEQQLRLIEAVGMENYLQTQA